MQTITSSSALASRPSGLGLRPLVTKRPQNFRIIISFKGDEWVVISYPYLQERSQNIGPIETQPKILNCFKQKKLCAT